MELLKIIIEGPAILKGYRTIIFGVFAIMAALGGWGMEALDPFLGGDISLAEFAQKTSDWMFNGAMASAVIYFRKALNK